MFWPLKITINITYVAHKLGIHDTCNNINIISINCKDIKLNLKHYLNWRNS